MMSRFSQVEIIKAKTQNISPNLLYSDVLRNVFEYLDVKDVTNCMLSCKLWKKCAEQASCWERLHREMFPNQVCNLKKSYRTILPSLQSIEPPLRRIVPLTKFYKFIFIICFCIACVGFGWTIKEFYTQYSMPSTEGIVVQNYISNTTSHDAGLVYFLNVSYIFNWSDQAYKGHTIYQDFDYTTTNYEDKLLWHLHSIVDHPAVTVYIPNNAPEHAHLHHFPSVISYLLVVVPIIVLNGVFGCLIHYFSTWKKSKQKETQYLSQKKFFVKTKTWFESLETNACNYTNPTALEVDAICKFNAFFRRWNCCSSLLVYGILMYFGYRFSDIEAPNPYGIVSIANSLFLVFWGCIYICQVFMYVFTRKKSSSLYTEHWRQPILWRKKNRQLGF